MTTSSLSRTCSTVEEPLVPSKCASRRSTAFTVQCIQRTVPNLLRYYSNCCPDRLHCSLDTFTEDTDGKMSSAAGGTSTDVPRKELSPEALARKIEKNRLNRLRLKEKKRAEREGDGSTAPQQKKTAPNESSSQRIEQKAAGNHSGNGSAVTKSILGGKLASAVGDRLYACTNSSSVAQNACTLQTDQFILWSLYCVRSTISLRSDFYSTYYHPYSCDC